MFEVLASSAARVSPWDIKTSPKKMWEPWEWRRRTSSEPMPRAPPVGAVVSMEERREGVQWCFGCLGLVI